MSVNASLLKSFRTWKHFETLALYWLIERPKNAFPSSKNALYHYLKTRHSERFEKRVGNSKTLCSQARVSMSVTTRRLLLFLARLIDLLTQNSTKFCLCEVVTWICFTSSCKKKFKKKNTAVHTRHNYCQTLFAHCVTTKAHCGKISIFLQKIKFLIFPFWHNHPKCRIWVFQFWHFQSIFVLLKFTCLVTLFDRKLQIFKNSPKWTSFGIFN